VISVNHAGGKVLVVNFVLRGQEIMAFNGGPMFKFNEAASLFVSCENQAEVDEYWEKLSAGGEKSQCGWLKDKYGLSWQIIPTALMKLMSDPDPQKAGAVMKAMMKMDKIIIADLETAYQRAA
jgi:predicted 3-demethylubiquinone-9 3-methyltransferase (glyoxalase superfamily)